MKRLPAPWFPWVHAVLMGGVMTAVVTATLAFWHAAGLWGWLQNWAVAWLVATPTIVALGPHARRWAARLATPPG